MTSWWRWCAVVDEDLAWVALGSNLGDPPRRLRVAARALAELGEVTHRSSLWQTRPVGGPPDQPDYLNAIVALHPAEPWGVPASLLERLLAVEAAQGRARRRRWEARTLDLDLLAFGQRILEEPGLTLPHPRMMERAFVLAPLSEVAPDWRHPVDGRSALDAWRALPVAEREAVWRSDHAWDGG